VRVRVVALAGLLGLAAGCGGTSAKGAVTTTAGDATTVGPATTSTTLGPKPPGDNGPYPWQAQARLYDDGSPDASWMAEATQVDGQASSDPGTQLVFLGDSITQGWTNVGVDAWDAFWVPRDPIDLGIISDTTQNVLWRIQNGALAGIKPRAVVLLIGTNDIGLGWTPAQVAQGIVACATAVRAAVPAAAIELLTVFPRGIATSSDNMEVQATNAALALDQLPANTSLVDMAPALSTSEGGPIPALFGDDLVHPDEAGYQVIAGRLMGIPVLASGS
jgi:lysophospholipase L1-like esterase